MSAKQTLADVDKKNLANIGGKIDSTNVSQKIVSTDVSWQIFLVYFDKKNPIWCWSKNSFGWCRFKNITSCGQTKQPWLKLSIFYIYILLKIENIF